MKYNGHYPDWTAAERAERHAAALELVTGERSGSPPLTAQERQLLDAIRRDGWALVSTNQFPRYIGKAA